MKNHRIRTIKYDTAKSARLTWAYPNMSHTTIGVTAFNSTIIKPESKNIIKPESKKPDAFASGFSCSFERIRSLAMSYSHMGTPTLPSAQLRFTSEFGMGSGGTTALLSLNKKGTI